MNSNANPSIDPADNDTLAGMLQFTFKKMMQGTDNKLPAQVIAYDRTNNRVQVQLLISQVTTNNTLVSRSQLASIPVFRFGGGGFMVNFNLIAGDLGWVIASDRDISLFLQSYAEAPPNTGRMFSFSDGLFFPDSMTGFTILDEDADNFVIQNTDATVKIAFSQTYIKITAPTVILDGPSQINGLLTATDGIIITGGGAVPFNVTGNMDMTGDLAVTGNITATGDITPHV